MKSVENPTNANHILKSGAKPTYQISTVHPKPELRVIGTTHHRIDSYFLHLTTHT